MAENEALEPRLSRRHFLAAAGAEAAVSLGPVAPLLAQEGAATNGWNDTTDVIIVGAGGAASAAAMLATGNDAEVILLEKSATYGGTTVKSGGVYDVPNNAVMKAEGIEDPEEDAMRFLARGAY